MTNSTLATDPLNPQRIAYCAPGRVLLTEDSGKTWLTFPTTDVAQRLPDSAVWMGDSRQLPMCSAVTLDSSHPDSLYATFLVASKVYGPPPSYYVGYYTTDRGETWQLAPVPSVQNAGGQLMGFFGGFSTNGKGVQALYNQKPAQQSEAWTVQAKETTDGGRTWAPANLACPASGPCLRWGAAPSAVSGMGAGFSQQVLMSTDHGKTWQATGQSAELHMDGPHELAALSDQAAVLFSGTASFPLRYTADGGQTWQLLALPDLPTSGSGLGAGFRGLQMLPDGRLLAMRSDPDQWMALLPGAKAWCQVRFTSASASPILFHVVGNQVWWLDNVFTQAKSGPLNQFDCRN